mgnify:CR=1 FL=1
MITFIDLLNKAVISQIPVVKSSMVGGSVDADDLLSFLCFVSDRFMSCTSCVSCNIVHLVSTCSSVMGQNGPKSISIAFVSGDDCLVQIA